MAKCRDKEKPMALPYLEQFYNVQGFYTTISDLKTNASSRIINSLIDALNAEDRLPRFLVIVIDKDMAVDFNDLDYDISKEFESVTNWLTRQVEIVVHRKKTQILARKPGAIGAESDPTVIYIDMIERPKTMHLWDKAKKLCEMRYKFNKSLHAAVDHQNHKILSIRSCMGAEHFDANSDLTNSGRIEFWREMDYLLGRYDNNSIKLQPRLHLKKKIFPQSNAS